MAIGTSTQPCGGGQCLLLLDSGTTHMGIPAPHFQHLLQQITASRPDCSVHRSSGYMIRCTEHGPEGLPLVSFNINDVTFNLPPSVYLVGGVVRFFITNARQVR